MINKKPKWPATFKAGNKKHIFLVVFLLALPLLFGFFHLVTTLIQYPTNKHYNCYGPPPGQALLNDQVPDIYKRPCASVSEYLFKSNLYQITGWLIVYGYMFLILLIIVLGAYLIKVKKYFFATIVFLGTAYVV